MALPDSVTVLEHDGVTYYVVGTAHVSQRSVDEVRRRSSPRSSPTSCASSSCKARHDALTKDSAFRDLDVFKVVREGKTLYLLAHLALARYQRRIGAQPRRQARRGAARRGRSGARARRPGRADRSRHQHHAAPDVGEPRRCGSARRCSASLVFRPSDDDEDGDADDGQITAAKVEKLKEPKALSEMLPSSARAVPEIKGPLIDERDQYLVSQDRRGRRGQEDGGRGGRRRARAGHEGAASPTPADRSRRAREAAAAVAVVDRAQVAGADRCSSGCWSGRRVRSDTRSSATTMLAWIIPTSVGAALFTLARRRLAALGRRRDRGGADRA